MPRPGPWISPRQTGLVGMPSTKQETMSVPPEIEARWTSRLIAVVDEVEALRRQRRAGRRASMRTRRRGRGVSIGRRPDFLTASMYFAEVPKMRHLLGVGIVEQHVAGPGWNGRAVVEQQRRAGGEAGDQPVPHHPAAGGEVEQAVARRPGSTGAGAPSGAGAACRRPSGRCISACRSCPTRTGCRADGRRAGARSRPASAR